MSNSNQQKSITCFIIDDEVLARKRLESLLTKVESIELLGSETATKNVLTRLAGINPDIVFMDVEMPGIDGFEAIRMIQETPGSSSVDGTVVIQLRIFADFLQKSQCGESHSLIFCGVA